MNQIIVNQDEVKDLEALEMLADGLTRLTGGGAITIKTMVVIETENVPAYFLMQDLLKGKVVKEIPAAVAAKSLTSGEPTVKGKKTRKTYKPRKAKIETPTAEAQEPGEVKPARKPIIMMRAWRVLNEIGGCDERITIEEKNHRLAKGEFEPGTILHHPKAGKQIVTGAKGTGQGMKPVEGGAA